MLREVFNFFNLLKIPFSKEMSPKLIIPDFRQNYEEVINNSPN